MKEKIFNFIFCIFCVIAVTFIFKNNKDVSIVIIDAVNLFFKKVFVSLFPMFIINDILITLNLPFYFYAVFNKLFKKVFRVSGVCAYVFVMSLISGTPSNAYILKSLVESGTITNEEASHYLYFTYFSNPLFLTLMLSQIFEINIVMKIIIVHYFSNIIIGIIVKNKAPIIANKRLEIKKENISTTLIKSINKSITTLLMILGTIVFYMLLSYIIANIINAESIFKVIVACFLEITNGLNCLNSINISLNIKEIIAIATISFGGLSINTQIKSILEDTKIDYKNFFRGRIMQMIISIIIIAFI